LLEINTYYFSLKVIRDVVLICRGRTGRVVLCCQ